MTRLRHTTKPCPDCQQTLVRVPRAPSERDEAEPSDGTRWGRYRCANLSCGWQGLLPRSPRKSRRGGSGSGRRAVLPLPLLAAVPWARAGSVLLVMALLALVGVQGTRHLLVESRSTAAATVSPGESYDGDPLPSHHPWLQPVSLQAAAAASAAMPHSTRPAGASPVPVVDGALPQAVEPLAMRRGCAWGQPGRNPYRGTVEQALVHARLPPEVVREVARRVHSRDVSDRLEIRTGRIHGVRNGQEFDPQRVALTFGHSLCLNSRVNFAPGHVEGADLYEVKDARGLRHAVMVPDVCGNVSVLGARGERRRGLMAQGAQGAQVAQVAHGNGGGDAEWWALATVATAGEAGTVPEPGTLAAVLLGLAALVGVSRSRRSRRSREPGACQTSTSEGPH